MSPSEDVKFSNVRGLYLRKYGSLEQENILRSIQGRNWLPETYWASGIVLRRATKYYPAAHSILPKSAGAITPLLYIAIRPRID